MNNVFRFFSFWIVISLQMFCISAQEIPSPLSDFFVETIYPSKIAGYHVDIMTGKLKDPNLTGVQTNIKNGRVESQYTFNEGKSSLAYEFKYSPGKTKESKSTTIVTSALGGRTVYEYSNGNIDSITVQIPSTKEGKWKDHRKETYEWSYFEGSGYLLMSHEILDAHQTLSLTTFEYDTAGRLISKTFSGNLTNRGHDQETYTIRYEYSQSKEGRRLTQIEDNGRRIMLEYDKKPSLPKSIYIGDENEVNIRYFIQYDKNDSLLSISVDDGSGKSANDLSNISEKRVVTRLSPEKSELYAYDMESRKPHLISRTTKKVSKSSEKISHEDIIMNRTTETEIKRDSQGKETVQKDQDNGESRREYDSQGRLVYEEQKDLSATSYSYNERGLVQKEIQNLSNGYSNTVQYRYDALGNVIEIIDPQGNSLHCEYDALGRLTKVSYPAVEDEGGEMVRPVLKRKYDHFDRLISEISETGYETQFQYNSRGQLAKTIYPDGSTRKLYYLADGNVDKIKNRDGSEEIFEYDALIRSADRKIYSPKGKLIRQSSYQFDSFRLIKSADTVDGVTRYHYDPAGRAWGSSYENTKQRSLSSEESSSKKPPLVDLPYRFFAATVDQYNVKNSHGQKVLEISETASDGETMITTMDAMGRPVQIKHLNSKGQPLDIRNIRYDLGGNKLSETVVLYDSKGNPQIRENEFKPNQTFQAPEPEYSLEIPYYGLKVKVYELDKEIVNEIFHVTNGYSHEEQYGVGIIGFGEVDPKIRVTYNNGILNHIEDVVENCSLISRSHGGVNVHYVHKPTKGFFTDIWNVFLAKVGYVSDYAKFLAVVWRQLISEMGGIQDGGVIYHFAHSSGGTDTFNASQLITRKERQHIIAYTFGTSTILSSNLFAETYNFISVRDGVGILGLVSHPTNVSWIGNMMGIPLVDHVMVSDSYREILAVLGGSFVEKYGAAVDNVFDAMGILSIAQMQQLTGTHRRRRS